LSPIMFPAVPQFEIKFGKDFHSTEYQGRKSRTGNPEQEIQNRKSRTGKIGPKRRVP